MISLPRLDIPKPPAFMLRKLPMLLHGSFRYTPFALQRLVVESVLQRTFRVAIAEGELDFLENRCVAIDIADVGLRWHLGYRHNKLCLLNTAHADVLIRGNLNEFMLLAGGQEDPDTLFFQRRLVIEGDTDLGLEVKNSLDAVELDGMPAYLQKMLQLFSE